MGDETTDEHQTSTAGAAAAAANFGARDDEGLNGRMPLNSLFFLLSLVSRSLSPLGRSSTCLLAWYYEMK